MSHIKRHPVNDADLLLYAEGELPARPSSRMRSHIAGCPGCQTELEKLQDGVKTLVQFHRDFALVVPAPRSTWEPLDVRIENWESRWRLHSLFKSLGAAFKLPNRVAAMAAMLLLVLCLILQPWHEIVSANELLGRAILAQSRSVSGAKGRVVHKRLLIHRRSRAHGQEKDAPINYESWQDGLQSRFRETSSSVEITDELTRVYETNHLDWKSPLSAAMYEKWQSSLPEKHDAVARSGSNELTLTTFASDRAQGDVIRKAQLVVSANDWLPHAVRLWLSDREYEINEVNSELLSWSQVEASVLNAPAVASLQVSTVTATRAGQPTRPSHIEHIFALPVASRNPLEEANRALSTLSILPVADDSAQQVVGKSSKSHKEPELLENAPDAPSHTFQLSRGSSAPGLASQATSATSPTVSTPARRRETAVTLMYQSGNVVPLVPGLQTGSTPAAILPPERMTYDPFKGFKSSTVVVNASQKPRPEDCDPLKTLGAKLGLVKKKKATPVASSKPGG